MGVGGSLDILAGEIRRAPVRMQKLGLEWLYRVYQEPGRMWWRYAKTNTLFAGILAQAVVRQSLQVMPRVNRASPPDSSRVGG
jgi:N-acetylglucosaminyldiphosphoundecaprenol N-acetyl-beta-D-mannosaminyltransferase